METGFIYQIFQLYKFQKSIEYGVSITTEVADPPPSYLFSTSRDYTISGQVRLIDRQSREVSNLCLLLELTKPWILRPTRQKFLFSGKHLSPIRNDNNEKLHNTFFFLFLIYNFIIYFLFYLLNAFFICYLKFIKFSFLSLLNYFILSCLNKVASLTYIQIVQQMSTQNLYTLSTAINKSVNNSDNFRIKCLSYSKIIAIFMCSLFSVFTLFIFLM